MTVPTTSNKVIGTGNGVTTVFPFTFGTLPSGDLVVTLFDTDGIEYPQTETTNYTVSGKGDEDGGAVTFLVAPANGWTVLIQRVLPETQPTDLKNQGSFYPRTIERMFDRVTFLIQQLAERVGAALTLPPQVEGVSTQLPVPDPSALVGWAPDGTQLQNYRVADLATDIAYGNKNYQTFTGTGAQVNYILLQNPGSLGNLDISIDGVTQVPGDDYTYSGTTLTFTTAPANGAAILVRYDIAVPVGFGIATSTAYTPVATGATTTVADYLDSLYGATGGALVRFRQNDANASTRTVQDKLRESVSIKDFGAVGDGITDDTAAVTKAMSYMANNGYGVHLPPGVYLCDPFVINTQFYDLQAMLSGDDRERCILRRRGTGAGPFIQLGASSSTVYQSGVNFSGVQIDGGATTNGPAIAMYDVVRTSFHQCRFRGGSDAVKMYGGISVSFYDCVADLALRGLDITKFTSLAGGGYPNLIKWIGGEIVDNTQWGVRFDYGNLLILRDCDIEGNGTTLGASEGGVYVGPNVGEAVFASDTNSPGVVISGCWIEANKGRAGVMLESGRNSLESSWWFSQAANITNDVYVTGGRYMATNCKFSFAKAANLLEGAGVLAGNLIQNTIGAVLTVDSIKTMILNGSSYPFVQYNGGRTIVASGISAPHVQVGSDSTGVNPTIAFSPAFKTGTVPKIKLTPVSNSAGTIDAPEAYNITATGFTIRKKSYNGTTISTANYQVDWEAVGEALGT